jgi:hypothetical protein
MERPGVAVGAVGCVGASNGGASAEHKKARGSLSGQHAAQLASRVDALAVYDAHRRLCDASPTAVAGRGELSKNHA